MEQQRPTLLTLPYDIRHLIYQHLFPPSKLIYIQARSNSLTALPTSRSEPSIPTALLTVNRDLHAEAAAYLYTTYLFHIVGAKWHCLANYSVLEDALRRYARLDENVYIHALSNGTHSRTGAILMHIGTEKLESVRRRGRGVAVSLEDLKREAREGGGGLMDELYRHWGDKFWWVGVGGFVAVLVAVAAWLVSALNIVSR